MTKYWCGGVDAPLSIIIKLCACNIRSVAQILDRFYSMLYLVHGSSRCHHLHDVSTSTVCSHRQTTTNDLSQCGQVRSDAKVLLGAALGYSEACHDLIKAQQSSVLTCNVLNALHRRQSSASELLWMQLTLFISKLTIEQQQP